MRAPFALEGGLDEGLLVAGSSCSGTRVVLRADDRGPSEAGADGALHAGGRTASTSTCDSRPGRRTLHPQLLL